MINHTKIQLLNPLRYINQMGPPYEIKNNSIFGRSIV